MTLYYILFAHKKMEPTFLPHFSNRHITRNSKKILLNLQQ